jgi:hypothetical protein
MITKNENKNCNIKNDDKTYFLFLPLVFWYHFVGVINFVSIIFMLLFYYRFLFIILYKYDFSPLIFSPENATRRCFYLLCRTIATIKGDSFHLVQNYSWKKPGSPACTYYYTDGYTFAEASPILLTC